MFHNTIVSVIIPVLNESKHIEEFITSLVKQTYPQTNMEWIFVDGLSSDGTVDVIKRYEKEYPIIIITNPNKTTPSSLNLAIKQAKGKYIVRMDAHTVYSENYIEKCVYYLQTTDAMNVGGIVVTVGEGFVGKAIANVLSSRFGVGNSSFRIGGYNGPVDTVPFGAFKKEVFDLVGLFNEKLLRSEDNDINSRIRKAGKIVLLEEEIKSKYYCRETIRALIKMALQNGNALFRTISENKDAMSIRHFVPFFYSISLILFPFLVRLNNTFKLLYILEFGLYLILDVVFSFRNTQIKYGLLELLLFPCFHFFYGLGSLMGLFGIKLY